MAFTTHYEYDIFLSYAHRDPRIAVNFCTPLTRVPPYLKQGKEEEL